MPVEKNLTLQPGLEQQKTALLAEARWINGSNIRFQNQLLQKNGGWTQLLAQTLVGTCRGMVSWEDFSSNQYLACGTEQRVELFFNGTIYDITPIAATHDLTTPFATVNGTQVVSTTDGSNPVTTGDWINIVNSVSVGNQVLRGLYQTTNSGNPFTFNSGTNFAATAGSLGTAASFVTTNTSPVVTVTLNNHGLTTGGTFNVGVSTTVGGLTLLGDYTATVTNANVFTINAGSNATSGATVSENSGHVRIQYLIPNGLVSATSATGYGDNIYNLGPYGFGALAGNEKPLRQWFFSKWGQDIVGNFTGDSIYLWDVTLGLTQNPMTLITQAPTPINAGIFVSAAAQQIIACAAGPTPGVADPMLVRWCDVADFTDWTATVTNQAGSFRLQYGSRIQGGLSVPQQNLIWTDTTLYAMQYIGFPLVYGFNPIGNGCGLIAARAAGVLGESVLWMSQKNFFLYEGGAPTLIPCSVWDQVFDNLTTAQIDKITAGPNSFYNEMNWFYPSAAGTGEVDSRVCYNKADNAWTQDMLARTAFIDQSTYGMPMGVDTTALIQQHEIATDNNGVAMVCSARTGWFKIEDGDLYMFLERMLPDFKSVIGSPTVQITIFTQDYGNSGETLTFTYGPYTVTPATEFFIVRARGRLASIQITSSDLGTAWRLGQILYYVAPAGKRL